MSEIDPVNLKFMDQLQADFGKMRILVEDLLDQYRAQYVAISGDFIVESGDTIEELSDHLSDGLQSFNRVVYVPEEGVSDFIEDVPISV